MEDITQDQNSAPGLDSTNEANGVSVYRSKALTRFISTPGADSRAYKAIEGVPEMARTLYAKCLTGQATYGEVVKATCQECVAFEGISKNVGECKSYRCPIWLYRPYQD